MIRLAEISITFFDYYAYLLYRQSKLSFPNMTVTATMLAATVEILATSKELKL